MFEHGVDNGPGVGNAKAWMGWAMGLEVLGHGAVCWKAGVVCSELVRCGRWVWCRSLSNPISVVLAAPNVMQSLSRARPRSPTRPFLSQACYCVCVHVAFHRNTMLMLAPCIMLLEGCVCVAVLGCMPPVNCYM